MNEARLEMMDDMGGFVEGEMTVSSNKSSSKPGEPDFNTLDEPIKKTILRDVKAVGIKFAHVLFPKEKKTLLKEWDLWGPLVLCTFMAMILQGSSAADNSNDGGPEFAEVFVIVWIGSMIVTLNSKLLGGNISFFQSVCVLGYCLLPTTIALIVCRFILLAEQTNFLFFLRFSVSMAGFAWATYVYILPFLLFYKLRKEHSKLILPSVVLLIYLFVLSIASMVFLGDSQKPGRKVLAVYPIFLFYFIISWLVISHSNT